jgi:hypothetical protein
MASIPASLPGLASPDADRGPVDAAQDSPDDDFEDRTGDSDVSAPPEASPESTVVRLPSLIRPGTRKVVLVYGADRNRRGDLVFTVLFKGATQPSAVAHVDMKKFYQLELIQFYEKFLHIREAIQTFPYKPPL